MTDLTPFIVPKSDQLNADDLIAGPMTIKITGVKATGTAEQPISIYFEGDNGKPYKPCKSMRRVLVQIWGKDGNGYAGRSMTLYRDPQVQFGGMAVGGIRISHMTGIDSDVTMALTATRASKKPFTVRPLKAAASPAGETLSREQAETALRTAASEGKQALETAWRRKSIAPHRDALWSLLDELKDAADQADRASGQEGADRDE